MLRKIAAIAALLCLSVPSSGAETLLNTTTSWDGGAIAYPEGEPEITAVKLIIEKDRVPPFHCHPVPTLGYVLKGTLKVETLDGQEVFLEAGDSVVEVMRTVHRGVALSPRVEIVVFYAGSNNMPTTVLPEDDPDFSFCNPNLPNKKFSFGNK